MSNYFVKFIEHSEEFYQLIRERPTAYILLSILVDRARKVELKMTDNVQVGEAFTGANDANLYGVGRQVYRTDLKKLENLTIIKTIKPTSKGTIVRIVNSSIFNISRDNLTSGSTSGSTSDQPAANQQPTTKQEVRSEKKETIEENSKKSDEEKSPKKETEPQSLGEKIEQQAPGDLMGFAEQFSKKGVVHA